jgi:uncharacterized protein YcfJ
MNKHILISSFAGLAVLVAGCQTPDGRVDNTGTGALIGAGTGAFMGAVAGGPRNGGGGALIGAAAGAIAGGLIGHLVDQDQERRLRDQAPQTYDRVDQGTPLSLADVKALAKAGIAEDVIINQIRNSRTIFHLSANDIIDLRDAGLTDKVINYLINTPASVIADQPKYVPQPPPPPPAETVIVTPGPGHVWCGGEWVWGVGGWHWRAGYWALPPRPTAVWVVGSWSHGPRGWRCERGHWR